MVAIYNTSGLKVADYEYDAWGNIISTTDTSGVSISTRNPFRYRGYYYDSETGLYYLQSRYYDPEIGRFISADASLNGTSVIGCNLYSYCENNPVNRSDPMGTCWKTVWNWVKQTAKRIIARITTTGAVQQHQPKPSLPYSSELDAAIAAGNDVQARTRDTDNEWGAQIVYDSATKTYGIVGPYEGQHSEVNHNLESNAVAVVHSHPYCTCHDGDNFSVKDENGKLWGDAEFAVDKNIPVYLAPPTRSYLLKLSPDPTSEEGYRIDIVLFVLENWDETIMGS